MNHTNATLMNHANATLMNHANATLMNHANATLMNHANATLINYDKGYHNETVLVIAFIFIIVCCYWYNAPSKEESKRRFHFGVERAKKKIELRNELKYGN